MFRKNYFTKIACPKQNKYGLIRKPALRDTKPGKYIESKAE